MTKKDTRQKRKLHIRKKLFGTTEKPRVFVYRSNKYMSVGISDDEAGKVLGSVKGDKSVKSCVALGEKIGKIMVAKKIEKACFDRSGYRFHTRLNAIVEGIKKNNISI